MRAMLDLLRCRVRALPHRRDREREMDDEMRLHLELEAEELVRHEGHAPAEARRRARLAFGSVERFKEEGREARAGYQVERLLRELGLTLRTLRGSRGFALVVVLTIALGSGGATLLFTLLNRIVLQPLPYSASERLVRVTHHAVGASDVDVGLSSGTYLHYRERARTLDGLAMYQELVLNLSAGDGSAERVHVAMAGPELFEVLRVQPALGRLYTAADDRGGFMDLNWTIPVLLGHDLWRRRFGSDSAVIGRVIRINDRPREVVGVLPPPVAVPDPQTQVWMLYMPERAMARLSGLGWSAIGRLRPDISPEQAAAELRTVLPDIAGRFRDATPARLAELGLVPQVMPLREAIVGDAATVLWALFGGMLVLLLVAVVNVANLFLVRAGHRAREIAVRRALGARSTDVARLFLLESALLTGAGALLGLLLAGPALALLVRAAPVNLPRLHEVRLDGWAVLFAAAVAVLGTLAFGALCALHERRDATIERALRAAGARGLAGPARRTRDALVAVQVALALVLLACAALMAQSVARLAAAPRGFETDGLLTVEIGLPYAKADRHRAIYLELLGHLRTLPGVTGASAASDVPLTGVWGNAYPLRRDDALRDRDEIGPPASLVFYTPGHLELMSTRVTQGSSPSDAASAPPHPVLVSGTLARRLFGDANAVGRRIKRIDDSGDEDPAQPAYTITGIVEDVRQRSLADPPAEAVYVPLLDPPVDPWIVPTEMTVVLRATLPPDALVASVRRAIAEYDPTLSVTRVRPMEAIVAASTARSTFLALLLVVAGATSLFLGAVGIWGVVAYTVRQRTAELGLRLALGSPSARVTALVLRDTLAIIFLGATAGVLLSLGTTQVLRSLLFGVSPTDPHALAAATASLVLVALLAAYLPARRASRVSPLVALQSG